MEKQAKEPRLNFRPVLFCALGLCFGVFLYGTLRFGGSSLSDFLFPVLITGLALFPLSRKRVCALLLCVAVAGGAGALFLHLSAERFLTVLPAGEYRVFGTVRSVSCHGGYTVAVLGGLSADGEPVGGECRVTLSGVSVRPADILLLEATLEPVGTDDLSWDSYARNDFSQGIRYRARARAYERTGRSGDPFLRLNAAIFDCLHSSLPQDEADVAYALLTGSAGGMDQDLSDAVRRGGVAHIFAVSGLHIGILFSALYFCFGFLKKYRVIPALLAAFLYAGVCGFPVSALRAVIMCGTLGIFRCFGKKYDFLDSVALAGGLVLLLFPAQWYSAGMRLSFGACLGLALFSGDLSRLFARLRFPRFLGSYLAADLSVLLFTAPVLSDAFGYLSVWGIALNLFLLPVLPVLFLGTLVCTLLGLILPFAAHVVLLPAAGMLSAFLTVFSVADVSFVIAGFSLGAGSALWLTGCVLLSSRFRLRFKPRCLLAAALAVLFSAAVVFENVVFYGVRIDVFSRDGGSVALVRTGGESVLLLDGDIGLRDCEDFLRRTCGGKIDVAAVLSERELAGVNTACFLNAGYICCKDQVETGLRGTEVRFGETFAVGELFFRFENRSKLSLSYGGKVVEFDFDAPSALGADLFVGGTDGRFRYYL